MELTLEYNNFANKIKQLIITSMHDFYFLKNDNISDYIKVKDEAALKANNHYRKEKSYSILRKLFAANQLKLISDMDICDLSNSNI